MSRAQAPSNADTIVVDPTTPAALKHRHASTDNQNLKTSTENDAIIPPIHPFRTLVLCFDGTGDQFDADNSNVESLFSMLKKDDRDKQMVYYQAGIGTYTSPAIATPFMANLSKTMDEAIAWYLDAHVMDGYEFLMQNYTANDRICIFGFSRGAYTARALAGMIHKVGLLPACNFQQVPFAYKMFTQADEAGWIQSTLFKKAFSNDVDIEFIGVWDTVDSVGLIPKRLPFTTSNTAVCTFRHALSLDERRAKFKANLWHRANAQDVKLGTDAHLAGNAVILAAAGAATPNPPGGVRASLYRSWRGKSGSVKSEPKANLSDLERKYAKDRAAPTDVLEVWFAGCHCDIGGGSVDNNTPHTLARISLRWMIRECFKTKSGIMFDADKLYEVGLDPATLYPDVLPRPPPLPVGDKKIRSIPKTALSAEAHKAMVDEEDIGPAGFEEQEELNDALSPVYDQLSLAKTWWVLEILPMKVMYQKAVDASWTWTWSANLGRARYIPRQKREGVNVHRSVKMRMETDHEDNSGKYQPRAQLTVEPTWVD